VNLKSRGEVYTVVYTALNPGPCMNGQGKEQRHQALFISNNCSELLNCEGFEDVTDLKMSGI
jgi:hypothetical protein